MSSETEEQVVFSPAQGANTVPMVHRSDLLALLEHLSVRHGEEEGDEETPVAFFVPAVDYCAAPLQR